MADIVPPKLKLLFELTAITVASYFVANTIFYIWIAAPLTLTKPSANIVTPPTTQHRKEHLADFTIIETRNLLAVQNTGREKSASQSGYRINSLAVSKRGFTLLGTVYSDIPKACRAIITHENKQKLYKLSDQIDDWELLEIRRGAVVLAKGAEKELLLVDENETMIGSGTGSRITQKVISRGYAQNQLRNLERLADSVAVVPKRIDGTQGLLIQTIRKRSFLHDMGLRKNDLLVKANNQSFMSLGDITSLMSMLEDESISLEILRDGTRQTLTYKLMN